MSWFCHVNRAATTTLQLPDTTVGQRTRFSELSGPADTSSLSSRDSKPRSPHAATGPLSLGSLSCVSAGPGPTPDRDPISCVTLQEQRCVLSWFRGWNVQQRDRFLKDLLGKAVTGKVCTLLDSLGALQVQDKLPNIFECQLRLWTQWFESWSEDESNHFLHMLEERDPNFVAHFYSLVANTAGRD